MPPIEAQPQRIGIPTGKAKPFRTVRWQSHDLQRIGISEPFIDNVSPKMILHRCRRAGERSIRHSMIIQTRTRALLTIPLLILASCSGDFIGVDSKNEPADDL